MSCLIWLQQDLRCGANPAIEQAVANGRHCFALYIYNERDAQPKNYSFCGLGEKRQAFIQGALTALGKKLAQQNIPLIIVSGDVMNCLGEVIAQKNITQVITTFTVDYDLQRYINAAKQRWRLLEWSVAAGNTLLPLHRFDKSILSDLYGGSFSRFRKRIKKLDISYQSQSLENIAAAPDAHQKSTSSPIHERCPLGEEQARASLRSYFTSQAPQTYKETRNQLAGVDFSTRLSWALSQGLLSVHEVISALRHHEQCFGANDSTQWIEFELLWRDYFYGYALLHGTSLFAFSGIAQTQPLTSHYSQRLRAWVQGTTPWPLVNAAMNELAETGWISNRSRQIVASALVNDLSVDWRFGAAYFQQALLDYDVAINWGNWQYIAGVGADPRGGRVFNLAKQQSIYDPDKIYCQRWAGESKSAPLNSVDAADWPI